MHAAAIYLTHVLHAINYTGTLDSVEFIIIRTKVCYTRAIFGMLLRVA